MKTKEERKLEAYDEYEKIINTTYYEYAKKLKEIDEEGDDEE